MPIGAIIIMDLMAVLVTEFRIIWFISPPLGEGHCPDLNEAIPEK